MALSQAPRESPPSEATFTSPLLFATPSSWVDVVMKDFDRFLLDHAAAEKKASGMAVSMLSHYPDRPELVEAMADLAIEELSHYREVVKWIHSRGQRTAADEKDPYVGRFRKSIRDGKEIYLLDRLLTAGIIEARGAERFALVGDALESGPLQKFYRAIARSEERHFELFYELASLYFAKDVVAERWQELLEDEAAIVRSLPLRAALH
ncbi:tRNA-(ms[2]io[6]A)-hydroxylase [Congregibacter sp.]|uniref:tRNA-(ms[2]io[6]A)-hydroxylase n=1 Tax=Congregibacter sp. TaxID=2744308 RepID=UPI003F6BD67B